eukprot:TRINITY_DN4353_c0_g3_i3.p1 TRINITY_DN4353_c0_g3~~TRINITY_DN4353_c0_g3_i3.p1  ORF type:complete len:260 (+),score=22.71 TRINITY_DN4353_c0_g3_i3:52-831(+)
MATAKRKGVPNDISYLVVIDFEATCDNSNPYFEHEIIEFPAVLVDLSQNSVVAEFHSYIKPEINTELTTFCINFTGITQDVVDEKGLTLSQVMSLFEDFLREHHLLSDQKEDPSDQKADWPYSFAVATDGPWDIQKFLAPECAKKGIELPAYFNRWVNLRWLYSDFFGCSRKGVDSMLNGLGLTFKGRPHSGLDDTRNIACIAIGLAERGCPMLLNDGLSSAHSVACVLPADRNKPDSRGRMKEEHFRAFQMSKKSKAS